VRSVVSQYWAIDEFLYSLVPPAHVTGVSQSAYLEKFSNVFGHVRKHHPVVSTDPERVVRISPDLVLVSSSARADYTAVVRSTGVPIHRMFTAFTTLEQVADAIRLVGYLTGEDAAAEAEYRRFTQAVEKARGRRPDGVAPPRVLGLGGLNTYGTETLFDDIVKTLGGVNVGAEGGLHGYDTVNAERVLRWNPEWIVAGADYDKTGQELARMMADPAISLTDAARKGRIVVLDFRVFLPMSPYTAALLDVLGEALYGR
jgi:iron complex transport system substrate-binding protein